MRVLLCAVVAALTIGTLGLSNALAAPATGAPIANAAGDIGGLQQVWYDRYGRWHPNRPRYAPRYLRPPVCRTVRVCDPFGFCRWTRRCY